MICTDLCILNADLKYTWYADLGWNIKCWNRYAEIDVY